MGMDMDMDMLESQFDIEDFFAQMELEQVELDQEEFEQDGYMAEDDVDYMFLNEVQADA